MTISPNIDNRIKILYLYVGNIIIHKHSENTNYCYCINDIMNDIKDNSSIYAQSFRYLLLFSIYHLYITSISISVRICTILFIIVLYLSFLICRFFIFFIMVKSLCTLLSALNWDLELHLILQYLYL